LETSTRARVGSLRRWGIKIIMLSRIRNLLAKAGCFLRCRGFFVRHNKR
jgi:hypothetical protein